MNIFEKSEKENKSIIDSIHEILTDRLNINIDKDDLSEIISEMGLSDYIELNKAIENKDLDYIKQMFGEETFLEYSMQGRTNLKSKASTRTTIANKKDNSSDSGSSSSSKNTSQSSSTNNTSFSDQGSLSPQEYKKRKDLKKSIENEIDELEKMKKLAGIS